MSCMQPVTAFGCQLETFLTLELELEIRARGQLDTLVLHALYLLYWGPSKD